MSAPRAILLMDDDRIDALLFKRVLRDLGSVSPPIHTLTGREALVYLQEKNDHRVGWIVLKYCP